MKNRFILIFILSLLFFINPASAIFDDWSSMSTVTLNASVPDDDFQIHLSSDDFSIPLKMWMNMNEDGNDTRILSSDNITVFPIWIEHLTARDDYSIWVNVTDSTTADTLYWYYGNPTATSVSDGDATFIFFDHFLGASVNTTKWDVVGSPSVTNSIITCTGTGGYEKILSDVTFGTDVTCEVYGQIPTPSSSTSEGFGFGEGVDKTAQFLAGYPTSNTLSAYTYQISAEGTNLGTGYTPYAHYTVERKSTTDVLFYIDGVFKATHSSQVPSLEANLTILAYQSGRSVNVDWISTRQYNVTNPEISDINLTVIVNTPPTTPIVISPETGVVLTTPEAVLLNVSSTDVDNDTIIYSFYGDTIDGSTFLGYNDSVNGTTFNWSVTTYDIYYWKAVAYDGFNYSDFTDVNQFTIIFPPNLTTPINSTTIYETYPPLTAYVKFDWQDVGAPQYWLLVAEDISFNIMSVDVHIGTNNSNQKLLVDKEYFWKVYSYNGSIYSDVSDVYSFNLTGNSTLTGSAIEGVVYQSNGDISAIAGAEVSIWNTTWSNSMITGSNGYYVFENLNSGTVYNLQAKSDRYWDSSIALVSAESDPVTNNFYLIDDLTDTEWWHYVEFTVQNVWGVTYLDVATNVYIGDSPTISESGKTESDGTISFHLNQNVQYHITFINSTLGINEDITLYPVATSYTVYIDSYSFDLPDTVTDDIQAYIVSSRINATHGYINFTWSDTSDLTTSINYYISDVDGNELYNTSTSNPDIFDSQIVTATDDRYIVRYIGVHPTHGIIDKTETVVFHGGRRVDFGWPHDWQYAVTALAFLIFIGALFGAKTAQYGAITVVMFAWIFKWIGWLDETNTSTLLVILAAVIAFGWTLRKSEEVKM